MVVPLCTHLNIITSTYYRHSPQIISLLIIVYAFYFYMGDQTMFSASENKMSQKLFELLSRRNEMREQISSIKHKLQENIISSTEFYHKYERLGLQLFQVNSDIQDLDPSENDYILETIQL